MKKLIISALSVVLLPLSANAAVGYISTSGVYKVAPSLAQATDISPTSGVIQLPDTVQPQDTATSTPVVTQPATIDIKSMSVQELQDLRSQIDDELDSRNAPATTNATPVVTTNTGGTGTTNTSSVPFRVESLKFEQTVGFRDIYYMGNKDIASITVDSNSNLSRSFGKINGENCTQSNNPLCGFYIIRFAPTEDLSIGYHTVVVTSTDGDTYSTTISVGEPEE